MPHAGPQDFEALRSKLAASNQDHVLRWWPELGSDQRAPLLRQLQGLNLEQIQRLYQEQQSGPSYSLDAVRPAPVVRLTDSMEDWEREQQAAARGEQALKDAQVAVLLVAGGQGTRLGFDGPKGSFPIGPVSGKSLFQIHAEKVLALSRRYQNPLPFYLMTSPENDAATKEFFTEHGYFGLEPSQVVFFEQGTMPAVDGSTGRLLLAAKDRLATSPNGHGGVLQALADGGHVDELTRRGVRYLFYYQVDNPLVKVADPAYLGYHIAAEAEMSLKVVRKLGPAEKLGNVVQVDGRTMIIEYSDLPKELAERRTGAGDLELWAGSIAVHVFSLDFLQRLAKGGSVLPYHRAIKRVPFVAANGDSIDPAEPNAIKFEMFVFDALPLARRVLVLETDRAEEFEPLKNAEGENSPATVKQAMSNLFAGWLEQAGLRVARRGDGSAAVPIEISPLVALDAGELRDRLTRTEAGTEPFLLDALTSEENA